MRTPKRTFRIDSLDAPDFRLRHPLALTVSEGPQGITVTWDELGESAQGPTEEEAAANLKQALAELYFLLRAAEGHLGPKEAAQLDLMKEVIDEP